MVLIGDAKATAHFSIGSGTKLAMEDGIALYEAFRATNNSDVATALAHFESRRRDEVEKTQHSADVSLVWFEHVNRFWNMDPTRFAFGLMTRSKAITYDNLALRAPEFVNEVDRVVARDVRALGFPAETAKPLAPMFQPFRLRGLTLENRIVVSPMCQYSAQDGLPNDWHLVHYGSRAIGGAGLMFTEMTDVSKDARISPGCAGIYEDAHEAAWKRIVDFVHAQSQTKFCLQLGHAGRKGATKLMWEGIDEPLEEGAWPIVSASPLPYFPHSVVPREMSRADMDEVIADYVAATRRADRAGFDMVEMHAAHGYLLASFISPLTNRRTDDYGGSLENRMRFPLEVFRAMRAAWPDEKPMSVRISATDWADGGLTGDDAVEVARAFADAGCDLIDVSTGQTVADAEPIFGRMFQTPFSDQIRNEAGLATMCVGAITISRSGQHHHRGRPCRPGRAGAAASRGSVLHPEGGGLVRRAGHPLSPAIPRRQGSDLPQQRPRPRGAARLAAEGKTQGPPRYLEGSGGVGERRGRGIAIALDRPHAEEAAEDRSTGAGRMHEALNHAKLAMLFRREFELCNVQEGRDHRAPERSRRAPRLRLRSVRRRRGSRRRRLRDVRQCHAVVDQGRGRDRRALQGHARGDQVGRHAGLPAHPVVHPLAQGGARRRHARADGDRRPRRARDPDGTARASKRRSPMPARGSNAPRPCASRDPAAPTSP